MATKNIAAYLTGPKVKPLEIKEAPMPTPAANEVIIRTRAVGINPVDWVILNQGAIVQEYPFILGFDISGDIHQVGANVTKFKAGDRVTALVGGLGNNSKGGFQLFVRAEESSVAKIPDFVTYAEGSVLPLCITTAASALFDKNQLALPLPQLEPKAQGKAVLIWGGSSVVGALAIQMVVAAGFDVATTASSHNMESLRSLGAKYVFDRKKSTIIEDIVTALKDTEFGGCLVAAAFNKDSLGKVSLESSEILQCGEIAKKLGGNMFVQTVKAPPPGMPCEFINPLKDQRVNIYLLLVCVVTEGLPEGVKTANGKLLLFRVCEIRQLISLVSLGNCHPGK